MIVLLLFFSLHSEKCLFDQFLAPHYFWWEVSSNSYHCFLCVTCLFFPSGCFSIFLLIFTFQKFDYNVLRCGFLCNYTTWGLLGFLDLWSVMFLIKFGNNFVHFFKCISCPILSSPSGTPVTISYNPSYLRLFPRSLRVWWVFFNIFFSVYFSLDDFYWSIFKVINPFLWVVLSAINLIQ